MSHLTLEALARLIDEAPAQSERAHLADCEVCREELDALRGQTDALAALPKMVPPPDAWPDLRVRLRDEGLVGPHRRGRGAPALRAAAAAFLFLGGGALGYAVRGVGSGDPAITAAPRQSVAAAGPAVAAPEREPADVNRGLGSPGVSDVEEAQEAFVTALDRYMAANGTEPADPAARLAALDNIVLTTAEALNEAPADPVINSFYLTAMAQRRAMFEQMAASSPDPVF